MICFPAGANVQRLNTSRCCAFSFCFHYPSSIIQFMSFCLGLPLPLFPSNFPSIISLCRELPLRMCPIQFFCLVLIISIKDLFSSTFSVILHSFCVDTYAHTYIHKNIHTHIHTISETLYP